MFWKDCLAARTHRMRRSTVREFLKLASQPGMISFAGGLPAPELFPLDEIGKASDIVMQKHGGKALQYRESEGIPELRQWLADHYQVSIANVLITSGAQQALDLVGRVLLNEGDPVAVENPTYLSLLTAWRPLEARFIPLASDEQGACVEDIPAGTKALYVIPNFQNPQGTTLSRERRMRLSEKSDQEELIIVEDDPYGELRYEGEPIESIFNLAGKCKSRVVYVGTFSKVIAPGFRIGWIIANAELIEALVLARQAMDLHTSSWNQFLVYELCASGFLPAHIKKLREVYRGRRDAMVSALERFMPDGISWTQPEGGMFLFATLPAEINGAELARKGARERVLVVPGADFHIVGGSNTIRLNFTNAQPEKIEQGIARLALVAKEMLATQDCAIR